MVDPTESSGERRKPWLRTALVAAAVAAVLALYDAAAFVGLVPPDGGTLERLAAAGVGVSAVAAAAWMLAKRPRKPKA